jgi:cytoskeleton protein RodZ
MLDKFAEELKQIRDSKGLTLQQVAVKTKIDYKFLVAMEDGDFEFFPDLYVRAFLKEYLRILGADEELYMKKYDSARKGEIYEVKESPPEEVKKKKEITPESKPDKQPEMKQPVIREVEKQSLFDTIRSYKRHEEDSSSSKKKKKNAMYYMTAVTILVAGVFYLIMFSGEDEIIIPEKSWDEVIENVQGIIPEDEEEQVAAMAERTSSTDSLQLTIRAADTSWVRIRLDDSRTDEFILFPNSQKTMKAASNYKIIFGNARGVSVDLNGKEVALNPKRTSVMRVQIDSKGVSELDQNTNLE